MLDNNARRFSPTPSPVARPRCSVPVHASSFAACYGTNQSNLIHAAREKVERPEVEDYLKRKGVW